MTLSKTSLKSTSCQSALSLLPDGLGFGLQSLNLLGLSLLLDPHVLLAVNGLQKHTLVLELVTLATHVEVLVHVRVHLLGIAELLQHTTKHTLAPHPQKLRGLARILGPLPLTDTGVTTKTLGSVHHMDAVTAVRSNSLLNNQTISHQLANAEARVGHGDFVTFIWVQPHAAFATLQN